MSIKGKAAVAKQKAVSGTAKIINRLRGVNTEGNG
jgi:hypothetical protein